MLRYLSLVLFLCAFSVAAEEPVPAYQVGDVLPSISLKDQHDKPHTLGAETRVLLYTTGMKGGGVIRDILDAEEADYLPSNNAMFISNISGMPKVIAGMIALPRMQSHDYAIVLDREGEVTSGIPADGNSATILQLDNMKITSIEITRDPVRVRQAIETAPPEAPAEAGE